MRPNEHFPKYCELGDLTLFGRQGFQQALEKFRVHLAIQTSCKVVSKFDRREDKMRSNLSLARKDQLAKNQISCPILFCTGILPKIRQFVPCWVRNGRGVLCENLEHAWSDMTCYSVHEGHMRIPKG